MENIVINHRVYVGDTLINVPETLSVYGATDGSQATDVSTDVGAYYILLLLVFICLWIVKKTSKRG